ncbi:hypothetical protein YC2023_018742 [Brassica napus]
MSCGFHQRLGSALPVHPTTPRMSKPPKPFVRETNVGARRRGLRRTILKSIKLEKKKIVLFLHQHTGLVRRRRDMGKRSKLSSPMTKLCFGRRSHTRAHQKFI